MKMGAMPLEMANAIDELGYRFLSEQGFNTAGCAKFSGRRKRLNHALKRAGARLELCFKYDPPAFCVRFVLKRKNEKTYSRVLRFVGADATPENNQREELYDGKNEGTH